jgi:hypothetical protein
MLLNAHTATRVYRECQFDILALLTGLSSICPIEGDSSGVIEIKWADGSVDMVPTFALIKAIVGNYYKKLNVGGSPITVTNGQLVLENIAAYVESVGTRDDDLEFFRSTIASLTVDTATLAPDTKIHKLDVASLHSKSGTSTVTAVRNNGYADRVLVDSLDLSNIVMTAPIKWGPLGFDASTITAPGLRSVSAQMPFMDGLVLTGKPRFSSVYTDLNVLSLDPNSTTIVVEIPSITDDTLSLDVDYAYTTDTRVPSNLQEPFADDSPISLAMLYPKKYVRVMRDNLVVVRMQAADTSENDRIVRVYNKSGESIRACNAWIFVTNPTVPTSLLGKKSGTIVPVNYVDIPAHSSIDFLFSSEYLSRSMSCAFMFPMKYLGAAHE